MTAYSVVYELEDAYHRKTRKTFETVADIADEASALAVADALADDLAALTGLDVLGYSVGQRIVYTDTVTAGSNKDAGVTFVLRKPDNRNADIKVPGPLTTIFDANGNADITNTLVTNFLNNFADGVGDFTFSDGEQWSTIISGKLDE